MITSWEDYLSPRGRSDAYRACHRRCRAAFDHQRDCIQQIFDARRPKVVACLGAGVLNDIPYRRFVEAGATIHLVDWLPDATDFGIAQSIVSDGPEGAHQCVYCRLADGDPRDYCCAYRQTGPSCSGLCDAFEASADQPASCQAFRRGHLPHVHRQDVTGGYASAFGMGLAAELRGVGSWRQALRRATALAHRIKNRRSKLHIPDGSVDLVVSSMVISQFEHEPYEYFSRQAAAVLGPPTLQSERRLRRSADQLRAILVHNQVEQHCQEIERILAPGGRCFVAFEMFHRADGDAVWYLVDGMHRALDALAQRFHFDIDGCPGPLADAGFKTNGGRSVVYHLLLAPKQP